MRGNIKSHEGYLKFRYHCFLRGTFHRHPRSPDSAATLFAQDHWANHYGRSDKNSKTLLNQTKEFLPLFEEMDVVPKNLPPSPPWLLKTARFNLSLCGQGGKHSNPSAYLALCQEVIRSYDDCIQVYTDASLVNSGLVGFGVHFVSNIPFHFQKTIVLD